MIIKTRGIVFKTFKYSETSVIAEIYTEEKGLRKYLVSGVRSKKAKVSPTLLQPMSLIDLVAYFREDRDLTRIKEIRPAYVYQSVPFDLFKGAIGLFMIEVAQKTIKESEENKPLFGFLFDVFTFLDQTEQPVSNLHLHYLLELSVQLGFVPGGICDADFPLFDLKEGVFIRNIPPHQHYLEEDLSKILFDLLECRTSFLSSGCFDKGTTKKAFATIVGILPVAFGEPAAHTRPSYLAGGNGVNTNRL